MSRRPKQKPPKKCPERFRGGAGTRLPPNFIQILEACRVPPDGLGVDLVKATDELWMSQSSRYEDILNDRSAAIFDNPLAADVPKAIREGLAERRMWGTLCSQPECVMIELVTRGKPSLKRCSECRQAFYCSTECQRKDWPRHKLACRDAAKHQSYKDGIIRLVRTLLANPGMLVPLKNYVRFLLGIDHDRTAGRHWNIHITMSTIPDDAVRGLQGEQKILQITKVEKFPLSDMTERLQGRYTLPARADPPPERINIDAWPIHMTFLTDDPGQGRNELLFTREWIFAEMLRQMPPSSACTLGGPVMWLLLLNKNIRDDVQNLFKLRTRGSLSSMPSEDLVEQELQENH